MPHWPAAGVARGAIGVSPTAMAGRWTLAGDRCIKQEVLLAGAFLVFARIKASQA